jgi:hypothetical protein
MSSSRKKYKAGRKREPSQGPDVRLMIASALAVAIVVWLLKTKGYL